MKVDPFDLAGRAGRVIGEREESYSTKIDGARLPRYFDRSGADGSS